MKITVSVDMGSNDSTNTIVHYLVVFTGILLAVQVISCRILNLVRQAHHLRHPIRPHVHDLGRSQLRVRLLLLPDQIRGGLHVTPGLGLDCLNLIVTCKVMDQRHFRFAMEELQFEWTQFKIRLIMVEMDAF